MTVAVYVRVSTQRQAQGQTIEQQLERLRAHLRDQGVEPASEAVFRDDGYSGATLNRPGLDRPRDAARAGEVDRVLVTDPDRLARNYVQLMVLLGELEHAGCEVAFLDRPRGRAPPAGPGSWPGPWAGSRRTSCCCRSAAPWPSTSAP